MEDALALLVLCLGTDGGLLEFGVPFREGWEPGVLQLGYAVEPLIREPGLGLLGLVRFDPLVVRGAGCQVVHDVQELVVTALQEHDLTVLACLRQPSLVGAVLHKVLLDQLQIISPAVVAKDGNLVSPNLDALSLFLCQALGMRYRELLSHCLADCCSPVSDVLVEACDQTLWVCVYQIVRVVGEVVCNRYRDWDMLAFVEQIRGGVLFLRLVLVGLKVVDNAVRVNSVLGNGRQVAFVHLAKVVFPNLDHVVASSAQCGSVG